MTQSQQEVAAERSKAEAEVRAARQEAVQLQAELEQARQSQTALQEVQRGGDCAGKSGARARRGEVGTQKGVPCKKGLCSCKEGGGFCASRRLCKEGSVQDCSTHEAPQLRARLEGLLRKRRLSRHIERHKC